MAGKSFGDFIPLHLRAGERSSSVLDWAKSWIGSNKPPIVLEPKDWFTTAHDIVGSTTNVDGMWEPKFQTNTYIWDVAPAAAATALEELRKA